MALLRSTFLIALSTVFISATYIEPNQEIRVQRSAKFDDKGFSEFTTESKTRGMLYGTKSFGPNSHGGWVGTGKIEHDFWKSSDGNQRVTGYIKQGRVLGGKFDGFKDTSGGIGYVHRFRRSPKFDDKGFSAFTPESNTRGMLYGTKSFGPNSHGGWVGTGKIEHDFWKSSDGNQRVTGYIKQDRVLGGKFDGFKDTSGGIGYVHRFRRSPKFDDKGFSAFTPESNTRGMLYGTKSFGPNSHGGWVGTGKIEHDFWKSSDGNQRVTGYIKQDRVLGGKFDGFKDTSGGIGYVHRFRRSPKFDDKGFSAFTPESNTRGMLYGTKSFGPNSHGGWVGTGKIEHDFWKSSDGNQRVTGYIKQDRVLGGKFDGFKDTSGGIGYVHRFRRSPKFDDKGFSAFTPESNTRGMLYGTKSFGPNSHGGWVGTGKVEHDFWKSSDGNQRVTGYIKQDRVLGGKFDGFKDTSGGIGYVHRFRRSPKFDDKGFSAFTPESNTRGMLYGTKSFGPNSHGGWVSTGKIEHDFWKSSDGNQKVTGYIKQDRVLGGKFDGFKDTSGGIGYVHRFRRSPKFDDKGFSAFTPESNTRGMLYGTKSFGLNSHGGWVGTGKIEHDFWKSSDGNQRVTGYIKQDRVLGGKFDGFKDTSGGIGYVHRFRRSPKFDDKGFSAFTPESNTRGMLYGTKSFGPNSHGGWVSTGKIEHDFWKSSDGNQKVTGYIKQDRVLGGKFDGFKDTSGGIGYTYQFR
ncbi:uncharacterized protein LOC142329574 [Lycorma delicatula]|uniref:uncharacterized protein LOC142329574 n=1 Tax=Lycorma delicatula TaxID=130591 RepID=UPI003F512980